MRIMNKIALELKNFKLRKNSMDFSKDGKINGFSTIIDGTKTNKLINKNYNHFAGTGVSTENIVKWFNKRFSLKFKPVKFLGKYRLSLWQTKDNSTIEYIITQKIFEIHRYDSESGHEILLSKKTYEHIDNVELYHLIMNYDVIDISKDGIDNIRKVLSKKKRAQYNYTIS